MEKKLVSNYTIMLRAILNMSRRQHPKSSSYTATYHPSGKLSKLDKPDMQDTAGKVRTNSYAIYSFSHGRAKVGRPSRIYLQQLCTDAGYSLEDLLGAMDDRDGWRERVREIYAGSMT